MRILIADDHRLIISGIRAALETADAEEAERFEVVGEASNGAEVLPLVNQLRPDAVLLDIRMPKFDGLACLEAMRKRYPDVKVVMLSVFTDVDHIQAAFTRGACGYIVKSINPRDLPAAIRQAVEGTVYHPVGVTEPSERQTAQSTGLTERELTMLAAVARGLSNRAISRELWVTEQTVKFHLTNIYRKLQVANRTEAARAAYRLGIVESPLVESREPAEAGLF